MSYDETVSFSLEVNVEKAYEDIRKLQTILYRSLDILRKMSGDENLDRIIMKIQRTIAALNSLRLAYAAFQAASGPLGWGLAIVGGIGAGLTAGETFYEVSNR